MKIFVCKDLKVSIMAHMASDYRKQSFEEKLVGGHLKIKYNPG